MPLLKCGCTSAPLDRSPRKQKSKSDSQISKERPDIGATETVAATANQMDQEPGDQHYQLLATIGHGCDGAATVSVARDRRTGGLVTVKKAGLEEVPCSFSQLQSELIMQRQLQHPQLLPIQAAFVHHNQLWTVTPLMAYGSCLDLIHAHFREGLPELVIAYILRDVLQALDYLHNRAIIHRGIRASHILISKEGGIKLTGFRHATSTIVGGQRSKIMFEFPKHYVSNLLWASPELLEQNLLGYDAKTDIYSVGITACELANGEAPYCQVPSTQMLLDKLENRTPLLLDASTVQDMEPDEAVDPGSGGKLTKEEKKEGCTISNRSFSIHFHQFVADCFTREPQDRPSASTLLQHPFIKQLRRRSVSLLPLPDMLRPVNPITTGSLPTSQGDSQVDDLAMELEQVEVAETWTF